MQTPASILIRKSKHASSDMTGYSLQELGVMVEKAVAELSIGRDYLPGLYEPIHYGLDGGGKRLRPLLCLMGCLAVGGDADNALNAAVGLEMFHNFTLLHDDVMDKSDTRRGRPSVCAKYGQNTAILSGDTMLTLATQLVMNVPDSVLRRVLDMFNKMAIDVYEGQRLDMEFEDRNTVTESEYIVMITKKTGALLGASVAIGSIVGGADDRVSESLYQYGVLLGIAFQILDDWLDVYGDPATFGKPIGGDILNDKKAFPALRAAAIPEAAEEIAAARRAFSGTELVDRVREIYNKFGVGDECRKAICRYTDEAEMCIEASGLPIDAVAPFIELVRKLASREK